MSVSLNLHPEIDMYLVLQWVWCPLAASRKREYDNSVIPWVEESMR